MTDNKNEFVSIKEALERPSVGDLKFYQIEISLMRELSNVNYIIHEHLDRATNKIFDGRFNYFLENIKFIPTPESYNSHTGKTILVSSINLEDITPKSIKMFLSRLIGNTTYTLNGDKITVGTMDDIMHEIKLPDAVFDINVTATNIKKDLKTSVHKFSMSTYVNLKRCENEVIPIFAKMFLDNLVIKTYEVKEVDVESVSADILKAVNFNPYSVKTTKDIKYLETTNRMSYDAIYNSDIVDMLKPIPYGYTNVLDNLLNNIIVSLRQHIANDVLHLKSIMRSMEKTTLIFMNSLTLQMSQDDLNKSSNVLTEVIGDNFDKNKLTPSEAYDMVCNLLLNKLLDVYSSEDNKNRMARVLAFAHILRENNYTRLIINLSELLNKLNYEFNYTLAEYPTNSNYLFGYDIYHGITRVIDDYKGYMGYAKNIYTALSVFDHLSTRLVVQDVIECIKSKANSETKEAESDASNVSNEVPSVDEKPLKEEIQEIFDKMDK